VNRDTYIMQTNLVSNGLIKVHKEMHVVSLEIC